MKVKIKTAILATIGLVAVTSTAFAAPVVVTETTTGSSGNWTYDFTFTNNVGQGQYLYFFGVSDPTGSISATPSNFYTYPGWAIGSINYNINWLQQGDYTITIASGTSQSGFEILDTAAAAQSSFEFFGYTYNYGAIYTGGLNDGGQPSFNPYFTGTTGAVPESSTWAMMLAGFAGLGFLGYRRNKAATFTA